MRIGKHEVNFSERDVVVLHLHNGHNIIGRFGGEDGDLQEITVRKPVAVLLQNVPNTHNHQVVMLPYLSLGVFPELDELAFPVREILLARISPENLAKVYIEKTSGIALA